MRDSLLAIAENKALLEVGRKAIEDLAVEFRDGIESLDSPDNVSRMRL